MTNTTSLWLYIGHNLSVVIKIMKFTLSYYTYGKPFTQKKIYGKPNPILTSFFYLKKIIEIHNSKQTQIYCPVS